MTQTYDPGANWRIVSDSIVRFATDGDHSVPLEDDSGTIPTPAADALVVALTNAVDDPEVVNDLVLARLVARLLLRILGPVRRPTAR